MSGNARQGLISEDELCVLFEVFPRCRSSDPLKLRADAEALARDAPGRVDAPARRGSRARRAGRRTARRQRRSSRTWSPGASARSCCWSWRHVPRALRRVSLASGGGQGRRAQPADGRPPPSAPWSSSSRRATDRSVRPRRVRPGRVFTIVPVLAFCIVFGLSMDYEVFLVSRVAEARRGGLSEGAAIVEGLSRTGGVITSAASIMIAVFASFAMGEFLPIQMLGFHPDRRRAARRHGRPDGHRPGAVAAWPEGGIGGRVRESNEPHRRESPMKRVITSGLVLIARSAGPSSRMRAAGSSTTTAAAAAGGVKELDEAFVKAIQSGDIDGVMKLYATDAVLFPPGEKAARGAGADSLQVELRSRTPTRSPTARSKDASTSRRRTSPPDGAT